MSQETPKQDPREAGLIEPEPAWEAAHAEKPFREAISKYGEHLSTEDKEKLLWLASQEAEEAIKRYAEKKGDERERAKTLLKNKVLEAIKQGVPGNLDNADISPEGRSFIEWSLTYLAKPRIEEILGFTEWTPAVKHASLRSLQTSLLDGLRTDSKVLGDFLRNNEMVHPREGEQKINTPAINTLKGLFIKELLMGRPNSAMGILKILKEDGPRDYSSYQEMLPILEHWQKFSEVDVVKTTEFDPRESVNNELEKLGFVWDPDSKKYIRL